MKQFTHRPTIEAAWDKCQFRVLMGGMGDDTVMLIAELYERGYELDEIVFCDTGSEFPHTYRFIADLTRWCEERHWSKVVWLHKYDQFGHPLKLIDMVEAAGTLPAAAFGMKTCSLRFKAETADKYFNNHPLAWAAWGVDRKGTKAADHTGQILRIVGLNADEPGRVARWQPQDKWVQVFPLFDWDIGERESTAVERVGLYYPGKSSCICCPHLNGRELVMLRDNYPQEYARVRRIEENYQLIEYRSDSTTIGLCRDKTIDMEIAAYEADPSKYCKFDDTKCQECR